MTGLKAKRGPLLASRPWTIRSRNRRNIQEGDGAPEGVWAVEWVGGVLLGAEFGGFPVPEGGEGPKREQTGILWENRPFLGVLRTCKRRFPVGRRGFPAGKQRRQGCRRRLQGCQRAFLV